jgi:hypothetical protein
MTIFNPIPNGRMSNTPFSKTVEFSSYNSDKIISPAKGTTVTSHNPTCSGNIKIEHFIDGETYYSNFCNVGNIMLFRGYQVSQGELIGTVGDSPIEYTVTNKKGDKLDVDKFLSGNFGGTKTKEEKKEKIKEPTYVNSNSKKPISNPFMSLLLSPLSVINSAFSEKSSISKKNGIKEDIDKIKKLIKY